MSTYPSVLPVFKQIQPEIFPEQLEKCIADYEDQLDELLKQSHLTWDNFMQPLAMLDNQLHSFWSPFAHLHAVMESETLRAAYNLCLPKLTEHAVKLMQNEKLYRAVQSIADGQAFHALTLAQQKVITEMLRDFHLSGIDLPTAEKKQYADLQQQLSQLTTKFEENVLDATQNFTLDIEDEKCLTGLPQQTIDVAKYNAEQKNKSGWTLTLDYPCYAAVMEHLDNREIRQQMYTAFVTRASDCGPNAGTFDNSVVMKEIVETRFALAKLLKYKNYAEYILTKRMAKQSDTVMAFLKDLVKRAKPFAEQEMKQLQQFAKTLDENITLEAWDIAFYSEKLKQTEYAFSSDAVRPWFQAEKVVDGMFKVIEKLFGMHVVEQQGIETWHPSVRVFSLYDAKNQLRGYFYTDLYARQHKRGGAWMDECRQRQKLSDQTIQQPVAFLNCNFVPPIGDKPSLITHDDVQTLFHEFGHCLHHLLTQVDEAPVSGINGVPWDAVEFPSQLMEQWCWDFETIQMISAHETTGEPLPKALFKKLLAAKNFHSGIQMMRQLEFSLFDFELHMNWKLDEKNQIQTTLNQIRHQIAVVPIAPFNRFQHSFSHIFAGGYAAGYYSYKWAEVLSSDAFSLFEEKGIFDFATGQSLLHSIFEQGGVRDPNELFVQFRGRAPQLDALLRHSGLVETNFSPNRVSP